MRDVARAHFGPLALFAGETLGVRGVAEDDVHQRDQLVGGDLPIGGAIACASGGSQCESTWHQPQRRAYSQP